LVLRVCAFLCCTSSGGRLFGSLTQLRTVAPSALSPRAFASFRSGWQQARALRRLLQAFAAGVLSETLHANLAWGQQARALRRLLQAFEAGVIEFYVTLPPFKLPFLAVASARPAAAPLAPCWHQLHSATAATSPCCCILLRHQLHSADAPAAFCSCIRAPITAPSPYYYHLACIARDLLLYHLPLAAAPAVASDALLLHHLSPAAVSATSCCDIHSTLLLLLLPHPPCSNHLGCGHCCFCSATNCLCCHCINYALLRRSLHHSLHLISCLSRCVSSILLPLRRHSLRHPPHSVNARACCYIRCVTAGDGPRSLGPTIAMHSVATGLLLPGVKRSRA